MPSGNPEATISPEQLAQYLDLIELPAQYRPEAQPVRDRHLLAALHKHHITTIPYENLALHYGGGQADIALDVDRLAARFLAGRGRGGYCMEGTLWFNHVLRALGFDAYLTGARIRFRQGGVPQGDYSGWVHVVNIVTLADGSRWAADSAFGGDGMTTPLPLDPAVVTRNLGVQEVRLARGPLPHMRAPPSPEREHWIYQYRNGPAREWNAFFAFTETEFLRPDFEVMSWYTGAHPDSFQTFTVLVVRFLRDEQGEVVGKVMLVDGVVKRNMGGKTETVLTCRTEEERVKALKEWFGIELTEEERLSIRGRSTELKGE